MYNNMSNIQIISSFAMAECYIYIYVFYIAILYFVIFNGIILKIIYQCLFHLFIIRLISLYVFQI